MRKIVFLLVVLVCSFGVSAQTQGTLEAFDKKGAAVGACPLKHIFGQSRGQRISRPRHGLAGIRKQFRRAD